ncbi:MAG: hypothetical protein HQ594_07445, partial [Candidatus Omnitrophica bacterium]|nr:hypothetical protein [Candidatus Omnitrophota bacterium]
MGVEKTIGKSIARVLLGDLFMNLDFMSSLVQKTSEGIDWIYSDKQRTSEFIDWIHSDIVDIAEEFIRKNDLNRASFIKDMNTVFKTDRFVSLLNKWVIEYYVKLFRVLDNPPPELVLERNPLNQFGLSKYVSKFNNKINIKWKRQKYFYKIASVILQSLVVLYLSMNRGVVISRKKKKYKVMREAIWGLYDVRGFYFHDDFLVDGDKVREDELLLFSRGVPLEEGRLKGYHDAIKSPYGHFDLQRIPVDVKTLLSRIISKYII